MTTHPMDTLKDSNTIQGRTRTWQKKMALLNETKLRRGMVSVMTKMGRLKSSKNNSRVYFILLEEKTPGPQVCKEKLLHVAG